MSASDPTAVLRSLASALTGGPALLPTAADVPEAGAAPLPASVPQRVALVVETSGSTGRQKRVALSADALLASAAAADAAMGGPGRWLLALPTHYIAGVNVLTRSIVSGTDPTFMPPGRFTADAFAQAVSGMAAPTPEVRRRYTSLVPVQLARALETPAGVDALRTFDVVLIGGQAMPTTLRQQAEQAGVHVVATYGASETSGGCVYDGVPLGPVHAELVDGELQLAGPMLAEGYLDDPERTAAAFVVRDAMRWYRTDDLAVIEAGVVQVVGRRDDVIVSGGEKVALGAIERVVRELPGLDGAVVTRQASEEWGEVPVVVTDQPAALDVLRSLLEARLGRVARPAAVIVVDEIPMLPTGKPDRRAIAGIAAQRRPIR